MSTSGVEVTVSTKPHPVRRFFGRLFSTIVGNRWLLGFYQVGTAFVGFGLTATYADHADTFVVLLFCGIWFLLVVGGIFLGHTTEDIRKQCDIAANVRADAKIAALEIQLREQRTDADRFTSAKLFLVQRIWWLTGDVEFWINGKSGLAGHQHDTFQLVELINDTLQELCSALSAAAGTEFGKSIEEVAFRATYLEVSGEGDHALLQYVGWWNRDMSRPRSMAAKETYKKGQGAAGEAWQRESPIVQDFKKPLKHWRENYTGQSEKYKSLICVPVRAGYGVNPDKISGVVTVDTQIEGYFGTSDNSTDEDHASAIVQPYGSFIALLVALDRFLTAKAERPAGAV